MEIVESRASYGTAIVWSKFEQCGGDCSRIEHLPKIRVLPKVGLGLGYAIHRLHFFYIFNSEHPLTNERN